MELRAVTSDADLERVLGVKARIDPILASTSEEVRFLMARLRGASLLLATLDGESAGFGLVGVFPEQEEEPFAYAELGVARGFEGQGVGGALHTALSEHARGLGKIELQLEVGEEDSGAIAFLEKRGYREVERQKALELDLGSLELEPPAIPEGVQIVPWVERPDLLPGMYRLHLEANADIPGLDSETTRSFDEWRAWELDRPNRRHDLSFVAFTPDEVVGSAALMVLPAGGFHGLTAVARSWRRRGLGRALKRTQIAAAKAAGLERLYTESEEGNEPMRRLNEQLGFRPVPGMVVMRGPLVS